MKYKIIATGPLDQIALDLFAPHAEVVVAPDPSEATVNALVADADVMVVRGDSVVTTATLDAAPKLKVIGRCGVGYNNIDIDAATAKRIPVVFTPGAGARAVAEGAIAFMLVLCKHVRYWDTQFKAGNWTSRFNTITGDLLRAEVTWLAGGIDGLRGPTSLRFTLRNGHLYSYWFE